MIKSILAELRVITLDNVSKLLDFIIDPKIPFAVGQYLRDLEGGILQLQNSANTIRGELVDIRKNLKSLRQTAKNLSGDIATLGGNAVNKSSVESMHTKYDQDQEKILELQNRESENQKKLDQLDEAIHKLQTRYDDMKAKLADMKSELEADDVLDAATEAADNAAVELDTDPDTE
jgi:chromosome segregation ATPase